MASKGSTISDLCDIFDFKNLIKTATCYMKNSTSSLVDVILTNKSQFCFNAFNFGCGISDWHNMTGVVVKGSTARTEKPRTNYHSYKNFDQEQFNEGVGGIPFHAAYVFNIDDIYGTLFTEIINEHAPVKERIVKSQRPAYMNGNLCRAVYKKRMLYKKFQKCKTPANWENYRAQRNFVTKLKKKSRQNYFFERCASGPKSKDFWPTIKPFLSKKGSDGGNEIILCENEKIVSNQSEVCEIFNEHFVNVAKDIGRDAPHYKSDFSDHPSILKTSQNLKATDCQKFSFSPVNSAKVEKVIASLNTKKATGVDNISGF